MEYLYSGRGENPLVQKKKGFCVISRSKDDYIHINGHSKYTTLSVVC